MTNRPRTEWLSHNWAHAIVLSRATIGPSTPRLDRLMLGPFRRWSADGEFVHVFPPVETPWTEEYALRHAETLAATLGSRRAIDVFARRAQLPSGFGVSLDERVVEYPWALARLSRGRVLDAGSTLNHAHVLDHFLPVIDELSIVTLAPEPHSYPERGVKYTFGDLRNLPFDDGRFDTVVSISTLEHVGMDNTGYGAPSQVVKNPHDEMQRAVRELARVAVLGGRMLITVPYGVREDHGWFRQFDRQDLADLIDAVSPLRVELTIFQYHSTGWRIGTLRSARRARYRDFTHDPRPVSDWAAAARAVACLDMVVG